MILDTTTLGVLPRQTQAVAFVCYPAGFRAIVDQRNGVAPVVRVPARGEEHMR
jgi:hypothetical protein